MEYSWSYEPMIVLSPPFVGNVFPLPYVITYVLVFEKKKRLDKK